MSKFKTLNTFVEIFPSSFSCAKRPFESSIKYTLTFETRETILSKQVVVIQRGGKGEHEHFLSFVIRLNRRKSPSAPLVRKEIETNFKFVVFPKVAVFPEVTEVPIVRGGCGVSRKFVKFVKKATSRS